MLDAEHHKLVNTIRKTSSLVNSGFVHRADDSGNNSIVGNDAEMLYVQGIDYKAIFQQCPFPMGVAALDGRFLMINTTFQRMTGLDRMQLENLTLFGLLAATDVHEVFRTLGTLLKAGSSGESAGPDGVVRQAASASGSTTQVTSSSEEHETETGSSGDDVHGIVSPGSGSGSGSRSANSNKENSEDSQDQDSGGSGTTVCNGYWSGALKRPNQDVSRGCHTCCMTCSQFPFFCYCCIHFELDLRNFSFFAFLLLVHDCLLVACRS